MSISIRQGSHVDLIYSDKEDDAVKIAVNSLRRDLFRVLNCNINTIANVPKIKLYIGSLNNEEAVVKNGLGEADLNDSALKNEDGSWRKEAFVILEKDGSLYITGTDRRGTIYGVYDFCQNQLGVSPWYFMADVNVRQLNSVEIEDNYKKADYPSVEYRGIFINDEEELEHWVQRYMGEETIGVKTYAEIFELLLRLKLNYIWPAMHVNSFNLKQENGALANKMGIVVGTSHCDMLMRSNNREWKPWLEKKGYTDVEYDYSIPGRNREKLEEYWRESIEQNKDFEVSYTLGMRGIHDSGFETKTLEGKTGRELLEAKIELLDSVITAQQKMIGEVLEGETQKNFVPYKEVLELYDNGLEVPEDLTLIWVNDNYGYVRRYPGDKERARKSGNGIYYHNSYWAPPGASYLFICSIPLSHTRNELKKAYEEGIRKLWVTNFGAIKPLEQQLSFYAQYAWDASKEASDTFNEQEFLEKWINQTFSGNYGKELAGMLTEFDQLTNVRKIEHMDMDVFSQTAYGDEAAYRIHRYEEMFETVNRIHGELPIQEKDAFFQIVAMKIHAAYYTNAMYYYADRSNLCMKQGKTSAAAKYTKLSKEYDHARRSMLYYYNNVMSNGKWNGILTPEDFPPPRTAIHPACMPPVTISEPKLIVTCQNEAGEINFATDSVKWFELANAGKGKLSCKINTSAYVCLEAEGLNCEAKTLDGKADKEVCCSNVSNELEYTIEISEETRILVSLNKEFVKNNRGITTEGSISIRTVDLNNTGNISGIDDGTGNIVIPVYTALAEEEGIYLEEDGMVSVEVGEVFKENVPGAGKGFLLIPNLGRGKGALLEGRDENSTISYNVRITTDMEQSGEELILELHRFPTLNSIGRIRIGVSVDGGEVFVLETESNDEYKGNWKWNILNNVDKLYMNLPKLKAGVHKITFHVIDKYFAFSRFVIYTKARKENSLGYITDIAAEQALPKEWDVKSFVKAFYGEQAAVIKPRPVLYMPEEYIGDTLTLEDISIKPDSFDCEVEPADIVKMGESIFEEKLIENACVADTVNAENINEDAAYEAVHIETAAALAQSEYAYTKNYDWNYCNSPSHGETGLAMYIREADKSFEESVEAPSLNYKIKTKGGKYRIWVRTFMWGMDTSHFALGIDDTLIPEEDIYKKKWRYSCENVWKWFPACEVEIAEGEHTLSFYAKSSRLRIEQIYVTKGKELPPVQA